MSHAGHVEIEPDGVCHGFGGLALPATDNRALGGDVIALECDSRFSCDRIQVDNRAPPRCRCRHIRGSARWQPRSKACRLTTHWRRWSVTLCSSIGLRRQSPTALSTRMSASIQPLRRRTGRALKQAHFLTIVTWLTHKSVRRRALTVRNTR